MNVFSLFAFVVYAAENIISPIPDGLPVVVPPPPKPEISFGQLATAAPTPIPQVLAAETTSTPAPTPTPTLIVTRKKSYTVALLGDSMIDTLGPDAPHIKNQLSSEYAANFTLLNYGVGGTNADYGLERITRDYTYLGKQIPSLVSIHPDIVIVESFGYNPYPQADGGIDRHWMTLAKIVDSLRANLPGVKIIIASTIAPNSKTFGDGAPGLAFSPTEKIERTNVIKQYLESTVKFAQSQHLPLADVYHASLDSSNDGILTYINGGDHIHYSDAGRALFAKKVTEAIRNNHLLE